MIIPIVHTAVSSESTPDDRDVLDQVEAVSGALKTLGHAVHAIPCDLDLARIKACLAEIRPHAVFNLVESLGGHMSLIHLVPSLLEAMHIPYTGSSAEALRVTTHKILAKEKMAAAGLPTPPWISFTPEPNADREDRSPSIDGDVIPTVWILKSLWEHASAGLDEDRIVSASKASDLYAPLKKISDETGDACFAEAFITGREFNLSILGASGGPTVLAPAEILFEGYAEDKPRIVGYKAKWAPDSWEYQHTPRRFEFPDSDTPLLETLKSLALSCWDLFGLKGYVRVDCRVGSGGRPWILEVNTNPCLSPDAGFAAALKQSGIPFPEAVDAILVDAIQ